MFFILFALLKAQDATQATESPDADSVEQTSDVESPEAAPVEGEEAAPVEGEEAAPVEEEVIEEDSNEAAEESSEDESLNKQINSTIKDIQKSLLEDGSEAEGVVMTEDNVSTLVGNLWPSVQNFIEQSLGEVSTLDSMAVDEVTEDEAALIRSNYFFFFKFLIIFF